MINFQSSDWFQIRRWVETELDRLRLKNEAVELSMEQTSVLRGEIRVLKRILALQKDVALNNVVEPSEY